MSNSHRVDQARLDTWLAETLHGTPGRSYTLRLLEEQPTGRAPVWDDLSGYVHEAHEDATRHLRSALGPTLAPFATPEDDPAYGYPSDLHLSTLMGYFGEVLAGFIAEHKALHGKQPWKVPAFLFRFHQVAFQKLQWRRDLLRQGLAPGSVDSDAAITVGRTGNDVLAFLPGPNGELAALLVCEAKCYSMHNKAKATGAHAQISAFSKTRCPAGVQEIIAVLNDTDTEEAREWCERLRHFYYSSASVPRCDVIVYATGNKPKTRDTWLATDKPDSEYTAKGSLEVIEVHLRDPSDLVQALYRPKS